MNKDDYNDNNDNNQGLQQHNTADVHSHEGIQPGRRTTSKLIYKAKQKPNNTINEEIVYLQTCILQGYAFMLRMHIFE